MTVPPSTIPVVVPLISKAEPASALLRMLFPEMGEIVMTGGVSFTVRLRVASVAGLPAASDTSAVTVNGPFASALRSPDEALTVQALFVTVPV